MSLLHDYRGDLGHVAGMEIGEIEGLLNAKDSLKTNKNIKAAFEQFQTAFTSAYQYSDFLYKMFYHIQGISKVDLLDDLRDYILSLKDETS